jgi:hypothetical protein
MRWREEEGEDEELGSVPGKLDGHMKPPQHGESVRTSGIIVRI